MFGLFLVGFLGCNEKTNTLGQGGEPDFELAEGTFAYLPMELVKQELEADKAFYILDARPSNDYDLDHIIGADSVPFYDVELYLEDYPVGNWIVAYCACPHSESGIVAQAFIDAGHEKVGIIDEGYLEWKAAGYPIE